MSMQATWGWILPQVTIKAGGMDAWVGLTANLGNAWKYSDCAQRTALWTLKVCGPQTIVKSENFSVLYSLQKIALAFVDERDRALPGASCHFGSAGIYNT